MDAIESAVVSFSQNVDHPRSGDGNVFSTVFRVMKRF